jgi:putative redox protein
MQLTVTHQGGVRFDVTSGRHTVITDQPIEDGGADAGMSPVELFVGSLAGCVGYFVAKFCARHRIPIDGFAIDAEWSMAEQPHRVGAVALRLRLPAEVTVEQRERLLKVARGCTVHHSQVVPPEVAITLQVGQRQSVT